MDIVNNNIINRFILVAILIITAIPSLFAQQEPATNIGKTLSEMKAIFPKLRFIEHTPNGDNAFFTIKDDRVIGECVMYAIGTGT